MEREWNLERVMAYITNEIEESLTLDYKSAGAISREEKKKIDITKDVSAMANSAGGTIIYGISEFQGEKKHLPEKIDPIDRTQYSREWLEQIINNIQPKIDRVLVHAVTVDNSVNSVIYVVEISEGYTAHQALDHKYYRRHNSISVSMNDYEVRLVMGKSQNPKIELSFDIFCEYVPQKLEDPRFNDISSNPFQTIHLRAFAMNIGRVYAKYVNAFIYVPVNLISEHEPRVKTPILKGDKYYYDWYKDNSFHMPGSGGYFDPILPETRQVWQLELKRNLNPSELEHLEIYWNVHADNSTMNEGQFSMKEMQIISQIDPYVSR